MRVCKLRLAWKVLRAGLIIGAAVLAFMPATARAQLIDPSTLQIGPQQGTTLDPVQIGGSQQVTVTNVSNGAGNLNVPWLLILGIPNVTSTSATITSVNNSPTSISPNGTSAIFTSSSTGSAYDQLPNTSTGGTNNSNNFVNWSGAESSILNMTATSFLLVEYNVPVTLSGGGTDTFQFANLPVGAFVIAYGIEGNHVYDTPFTEAGLETGQNHPVPAPASAILAGLGGLGAGVGGVARRFRRTRLLAA